MTLVRTLARGSATSRQQQKDGPLPFVLMGLGALMVVAALVLMFIPRSPGSGEGTSTQPPETTVEPSAVPANEQSKPAEPGSEPADENPSEPRATQFNTSDRPKVGEFAWYRNDISAAGPGESSVMLERYDSIKGGWKGYLYNKPSLEGVSVLEELLNVTIEGDEQNVTVTFDWYWAQNKDTGDNWENTTEDSVFTGKASGARVDASGPGEVHLTDFWVDGDTEYAVGYVTWSDDSGGLIALVRP